MNREKGWFCLKCGYHMNATTCTTEAGASPKEGDVTVCINCGELYIRHSKKWYLPTIDERDAMPEYLKQVVARIQAIRQQVVHEDLRFTRVYTQ